MSLATPFFSAFGPLLFGHRRLADLDRLLEQVRSLHSLAEYRATLGEFFPQALLSRTPKKTNSRERFFPPRVTFWAFLAQVLERGSSCRDAVRRIRAWWQVERPRRKAPSTATGGYCTARARLAGRTLQQIGDHVAEHLERSTPAAELWHGRRVQIIDGTTASMPDTPENQAEWPQSRTQKPGCGFPLVKLVGLFSLASGALLHLAEGNQHQHENQLARRLWRFLQAGMVVLADRGFCSYLDLSLIRRRGADAVMRLHQARKVNWAQGTPLSSHERLVTWSKPIQRPPGCSPEEFAALPPSLSVRLIRYQVHTPGFRTREVILVTTLLDAQTLPAAVLAELYFQRWSVELHFREIKTALGLDVLRCLSPALVRKEIALQRIAYNLIRRLMQAASVCHHVPLRRLSFQGALDSVRHWAAALQAVAKQPRRQQALVASLLQTIASDLLPERPNRSEPRVRKRRAKNYHLLTKPRSHMQVPAHRNRPTQLSEANLN